VILAGACIVRTVMEMLDKNELTVSDRGLRHGLLVERFGQQSVVQVVHPIVTTGRVRGARERASHIPDSLAVPS